MDAFNAAIARLQLSVTKSNSKIDTLVAGQDAAVKTAVDVALTDAAATINTVSDQLDTKNG